MDEENTKHTTDRLGLMEILAGQTEGALVEGESDIAKGILARNRGMLGRSEEETLPNEGEEIVDEQTDEQKAAEAEAAAAQAAAAEAAKAAAAAQPPATQRYKVQVDGEEQEVDLATLVAEYQKDKYGSKKMRAAAQLEQDLQRQQMELLEERNKLLDLQNQAMQRLDSTASKQPDTAKNLSAKDALKQANDATLVGDFDKSADLLDQVIAARVAEALKGREESLTTQVSVEAQKAAAAAQRNMEWQAAVRFAAKANPDLFDDPDLKAMLELKANALTRQNESASPLDIIEAAVNEVNSFVAKFKTPAVPTSLSLDAELLKKREAEAEAAKKMSIAANATSGRASSGIPSKREPETASDIVKERMAQQWAVREAYEKAHTRR